MKFSRSGHVLLLSGLVLSLAVAACTTDDVASPPGEAPDSPEAESGSVAEPLHAHGGQGRFMWWRFERARRQAAFDAYLATNADDYTSFKNAPLGSSGIPMVMLRLFPDLFPGIWGQPSEAFAPVGLASDDLEPGRVLPLGLGFTGVPFPTPNGPVSINVVNLTCAGCHTGRVEGANGVARSVLGAPSTTFTRFRGAVFATVTSPSYTPENFRAALLAKPAGFLYGDPALADQENLERGLFLAPGGAEALLGALKARSIAGAQRFAATLGTYTYAPTPNAPDPTGSTPGYLDAIGAGIAVALDPALTPEQMKAAVPPLPAMIDIMSVWNQANRPFAQWDGSITTKLHRNLAAEFGVVGDPTKVSMDNAIRTTRLTEHMPSPPYPFDVARDGVARGADLYGKYCASCHTPGGSAMSFTPAQAGTDPNRAMIWTPMNMAVIRGALRIACTDPVACNQADGTPVPDEQIIRNTGTYLAPPLDGIWARAPYLHNGSVPTLRALLTKVRPAQFYRGNVRYDQKAVGFVSEVATGSAALYDTTKSGNSNAGHDTAAFLGDIDWSADSAKTNDLLEYMKTL